MSDDVEEDVNRALIAYQKKDIFKAWGLDHLRKQGPAFLLKGPPGTGKTSIAKYIAYKVGRGFKSLDTSVMSSEGAPGDYEKNVRAFFEECRERKNATIFMDECDHLLISRSLIGEAGRTWQLGGVETLMTEMNTYPGLILCATNHSELMDPALSDRFLAIIDVLPPDFAARIRLWKVKLPKSFPHQLNEDERKILSKYNLTGRQIENVIYNVGLHGLYTSKVNFLSFQKFCNKELKKHLGK